MKLIRLYILRGRTFCLLLFLVLLASTDTLAIVSAQEGSPVDEAATSATIPDDLRLSASTKPAGESKMPDIVGKWRRVAESGMSAELTILPVENREGLFFVEVADYGNGLVQWRRDNLHDFQGYFTVGKLGDRTVGCSLTMGPNASVRIVLSPFEDQRKQLLRSGEAKTERELDQKLVSDWIRFEAPATPEPNLTVTLVKTELAPNRVGDLLRVKYRGQPYRFFSNDTYRSVIVVAPSKAQEEIEAELHKLDDPNVNIPNNYAAPPTIPPPTIAPSTLANQLQAATARLPDTPAAKQLVEQLEAQESAAASAAQEIRRLQANGDAVETIAPHQAQLKAHLQTAFELKMQLEELQVKELQSRLSRLERQIGQRKELRERIIARRAAELISGDSLRWNSPTTAEPSPANLLNASTEVGVPASKPGAIDEKNEKEITKALPISEEQKLRWRSGIVEIFAVAKIATYADIQHISIGGGVVVSSSGRVLSQLSDPPKDSTFLARLDDGSEFPLQLVENPGSSLYVFQLPPGTRINHYFKLALNQFAVSDEVYVFGNSMGSPDHTPSLFTAQVALKDRRVAKHDLIQLALWQLSKPDNYGAAGSWPVLNAKGELLGITLRDTFDLLLVLPVEELKKVFPKTLGEMINSSSVMRSESLPSSPQPPIQIAPTYTPAPGMEAAGIEAIAAGLDASEAAIKNISVTTDYKKRHAYGLPFDAPIELTLVTKTIVDDGGRLRVETAGQQVNIEPDGKSARAYNGRWETVFRDGVARSLTWYESNPPTASIDNSPSLHGIHPREFTTHFQSKSVSEIIRSSAAEVAERTMWDDRPVTIVQTTPIQNANDARRYRFWIDQQRCVVVRRAIAIRYAAGQPWQEYARIENHDYQQIAPGIWLPNKVKYESLEVTPELAPAKLSWSYEGTNRDWKVNSELPADTFELAFPDGTVANDHRAPKSEKEAQGASEDEANSLQKTEMESFRGTWCFDVLQSSAWPKPIGTPTDSAGRKSEQRWTIEGNHITWTSLDEEPIDVRFTIDPTKTPKQIDITFLSGPQKGMKSIGIYEPQKGNANYLWLCMTNPGSDAPRPTEVGYSSEKQQSMIGIYPVEKPNTPSVPEALKRFQGMWQMTLCDSTLEAFGASQEVVKKWSWTIRGDEIQWSRDGEIWKLKLNVETSKSPGQKSLSELDLTFLTGPHTGVKCLGMYQWGGVDQSQLMIAIQDPGSDAPRPTQFSMNSAIKTGLMILEPRSSNR